jgi:uncharacterized protein YqiB (DUF1249 family)
MTTDELLTKATELQKFKMLIASDEALCITIRNKIKYTTHLRTEQLEETWIKEFDNLICDVECYKGYDIEKVTSACAHLIAWIIRRENEPR